MIGYVIWSLVLLGLMLFVAAYLVWYERKFASRMQRRVGPYWVGYPHGWLQSIADAIKLLRKEDIVPEAADRLLFNAAPFLFMVPAMLLFAVLPFAPKWILADLNVGILYFFGVSSLVIFGVIMAAWGSNNKYAMLSGMRYMSQMISYEVPLVLSGLVPVVLAGSMKLSDIVAMQKVPFVFYPVIGQVSFIVFLLAALAEGNRAPFDIPEAESELVAGFNIEYSGWKFAMFYVGEYVHLMAVSIVAAVLFLGGWRGPWLHPFLWLALKSLFMFSVILWLRWSYLRLRVDQLMRWNWRVLVPTSLFTLLLAGLWVVGRL